LIASLVVEQIDGATKVIIKISDARGKLALIRTPQAK
jgi:hypothetical protein